LSLPSGSGGDGGEEGRAHGTDAAHSLAPTATTCLSSLRMDVSRLLLHGFCDLFYLAERTDGAKLGDFGPAVALEVSSLTQEGKMALTYSGVGMTPSCCIIGRAL